LYEFTFERVNDLALQEARDVGEELKSAPPQVVVLCRERRAVLRAVHLRERLVLVGLHAQIRRHLVEPLRRVIARDRRERDLARSPIPRKRRLGHTPDPQQPAHVRVPSLGEDPKAHKPARLVIFCSRDLVVGDRLAHARVHGSRLGRAPW
jgi:hypothetical protein